MSTRVRKNVRWRRGEEGKGGAGGRCGRARWGDKRSVCHPRFFTNVDEDLLSQRFSTNRTPTKKPELFFHKKTRIVFLD